MIRITSGNYKNRRLKMPSGIRPTQEKVRKAVFDILGDIEGLSFLELFAGSGAVAMEALSRGAGRVVLAEKESRCLAVIRSNLEKLGITDCVLLSLDAEQAVKRLFSSKNMFDIVFFDPPYLRDEAKKTLQTIGEYDILAPNGIIVVQHARKESLKDGDCPRFSLMKEADYGDTRLSFLRKRL